MERLQLCCQGITITLKLPLQLWQEADYSHLPADVLRLVFRLAFDGNQSVQSTPHLHALGSLPSLMDAYRQWVSIRLTCRHWDEVGRPCTEGLGVHNASYSWHFSIIKLESICVAVLSPEAHCTVALP